MSTGATYTSIISKRILGTQDFKDRFLEYLMERTREDFERTWGQDGVYDDGLAIAADGNDKFQITGTSQATDGNGALLDVNNLTEKTGIQFENALSVDYYIGLKKVVRPVDVAINPRNGNPDYTHYEDYIGDSADPDTVVDNGTTITFGVDSVTETGVDNSGRQAMVYLKTPAANGTSAAVAIETATVVWTGTVNQITTTGLLGQATVSTTVSDYTVVLLGPLVKRNTDLSSVDGVCFIGTVTGVGAGSPPSAFDVSNQQSLIGSLSQLHEITRVEASNSRLKVDVKALSTESGIDQIRVTKLGTGTVFSVDEDGNVNIEGNLDVTGITTKKNHVQINSTETITDSLTAGDDGATDSHLIKGTWRHTNNAGSANYLYVNGTTGRVGINRTDDGTSALAVNGYVDVSAKLTTQDFEVTANVDGNFVSSGLDALGTVADPWGDAYLTSVFAANLADIAGGGGTIDLDASIDPTGADDTYDLASALAMMSGIWTHDLVLDATPGRGVGSDIAPQADGTYNIGSPSRRWDTLYANNVSFSGDFLPQVDDTQDIGSSALRWTEGHYSKTIHIGDAAAYIPGMIFNAQYTSASANNDASLFDYTWSSIASSVARTGLNSSIAQTGTYSSASLVGAGFYTNLANDGSVVDVYGVSSELDIDTASMSITASHIPAAVHALATKNGAATIDRMSSLLVDSNIAAGGVTYQSLIRARQTGNGGSANYGLWIDGLGGTGTTYGLYLSGLSTTNDSCYGIFMEDVAGLNFQTSYAIRTGDQRIQFGTGALPTDRDSHLYLDRTWATGEATETIAHGIHIQETHAGTEVISMHGITSLVTGSQTGTSNMTAIDAGHFTASYTGGTSTGTITTMRGLYAETSHNDADHTVTSVYGVHVGAGTFSGASAPTREHGVSIDTRNTGATYLYGLWSGTKCRIDQSGTSAPALILTDSTTESDEPIYASNGLHVKMADPAIMLEDTGVSTTTPGRIWRASNNGGVLLFACEDEDGSPANTLPSVLVSNSFSSGTGALTVQNNGDAGDWSAFHINAGGNTASQNHITWSFTSITAANGPGVSALRTSATDADLYLHATNSTSKTAFIQLDGSASQVLVNYDLFVDTQGHFGNSGNTGPSEALHVRDSSSSAVGAIFEYSTFVHPFTNLAQADTLFSIGYFSGGTRLQCFTESTIDTAIHIDGYSGDTTPDSTTATTSTGIVDVRASISNGGAAATSCGADDNLFVVRNDVNVAFIVKGDGDAYTDGTHQTYDEEMDALACQDLAYVSAGLPQHVKSYDVERLEEMGIMVNGFMSLNRSRALMLGAIGEMYGVMNMLLDKLGLDYETLRKELRSKTIEE